MVAMRFVRGFLRLAFTLVLLFGPLALCFRQGWVPPQLNPLRPLDLADPTGFDFLLDWRIAELGNDREGCRRVLRPPYIEAALIADNPPKNGCGWTNSVRLTTVAGARFPIDKLTCPAAAAFALWMAHEVQPAAEAEFGRRISAIEHMGGYACRNIISDRTFLRGLRSQHATANAVDIAAFTLEDGRRISVLRGWKSNGPEARFLRTIHVRACRYFRVAISPDYNRAHENHFHFDRGYGSLCR